MKKCDEEVITQLGKLCEQADEREATLKRLLEEHMAKLQAMEKEVADLKGTTCLQSTCEHIICQR